MQLKNTFHTVYDNVFNRAKFKEAQEAAYEQAVNGVLALYSKAFDKVGISSTKQKELVENFYVKKQKEVDLAGLTNALEDILIYNRKEICDSGNIEYSSVDVLVDDVIQEKQKRENPGNFGKVVKYSLATLVGAAILGAAGVAYSAVGDPAPQQGVATHPSG